MKLTILVLALLTAGCETISRDSRIDNRIADYKRCKDAGMIATESEAGFIFCEPPKEPAK